MDALPRKAWDGRTEIFFPRQGFRKSTGKTCWISPSAKSPTAMWMAVTAEYAFHEKAGQSQDSFVFTYLDSFLRAEPPLSPSFHPQSVLSDSRSLQGGRTQFSRCCYLIIDLAPIFGRGGGARHLSQSPDLGG
jgi:hypothetical protein